MAEGESAGSEDRGLSLERRLQLLTGVPAFAHLPTPALEGLAARLEEERFPLDGIVAAEDDAEDRLYLIVEGRARASTTGPSGPVPLASMGSGELFGEIALLEPGGRRQATVTAVEPLLLLSLRAADFRRLLEEHPEVHAAFAKVADDLRVTKFLKQASPFSTLDGERLRRLASRLKRFEVPAGTTIIRQDESGEECYLLQSGRVEVLARGAPGDEYHLATLGPGSILGEAALLTDEPRNATVRALEPCTLLALRRADLLESIGEDRQTGQRVLELVHLHDRPRRVSGMEAHHRTTILGENITTLRDPRRDVYYRLSAIGWFLWQRLDGQHAVQDLASEYGAAHGALPPHTVIETVAGLVEAGFAKGAKPGPGLPRDIDRSALWQRAVAAIRRIIE
jgi:putative peptide zinc metalloprotease protein